MNRSLLYAVIIILMGTALIRDKVPAEPHFQDWDRINDCEMAVGQFADRGTDMWHEHMESCVYLDADYLDVPFQPEGEEQEPVL